MTPLQQTALDFARECLGYDTAKLHPNGDLELSFVPPRGFNDFRYTDLNAVMGAVCEWCDRHELNIDMYYVPAPSGMWHIDVNCDPIESRDPCHALLAACVEANRKLKGFSHG